MAITIVDIANMAGVSPSTVSRALNNNSSVKPSTLRQINAVIEQNNFKPLRVHKKKEKAAPKARSAAAYNFSMIWSGGVEASMGITAQEIMRGLSATARQFNAAINIEFLPRNEGDAELPESRPVDGYFLSGRNFSDSFLNRLGHTPAIWLLQSNPGDFGDRVQPDHTRVGLLACQYLSRENCRRLCCISCSNYDSFYRYWKTREQAFRNAAHIAGLPCDTLHLDFNDRITAPVEVRKRAAEEAIRRLKSLPEAPDGIFVANSLGFPLYMELAANGIRPGQDLKIVAGDKELCDNYGMPEAAQIDIAAGEIGELAMEAMMWRLQRPRLSPITYMIKPSLIAPGGN